MGQNRLIAAISLLLVASACSAEVALPDRSDPAVQAEEVHIAEFLETTDDVRVPDGCEVRLLGQEGETSYVWAHCEGPIEDSERSGWSGPARIDGEAVSVPRDGSLYGPDIKEMFPPDIAAVILSDREDVRP